MKTLLDHKGRVKAIKGDGNIISNREHMTKSKTPNGTGKQPQEWIDGNQKENCRKRATLHTPSIRFTHII